MRPEDAVDVALLAGALAGAALAFGAVESAAAMIAGFFVTMGDLVAFVSAERWKTVAERWSHEGARR